MQTNSQYRVNNLCSLVPAHPRLAKEIEYQLAQMSMPRAVEEIPPLMEQLIRRRGELAGFDSEPVATLIAGLDRAIGRLNNYENVLMDREKQNRSQDFVVGPGTANQKPPGGWGAKYD